MEKMNLGQNFALFSEYWSPKVVGELNDFVVKVAKVKGEFVWHHHDHEDELFLVIRGRLLIRVREESNSERDIWVEEGELIIILHGVEPNTTINTGNVHNERTVLHEKHP